MMTYNNTFLRYYFAQNISTMISDLIIIVIDGSIILILYIIYYCFYNVEVIRMQV